MMLTKKDRSSRGLVWLCLVWLFVWVGWAMVFWMLVAWLVCAASAADVTPGYMFTEGEKNITHTKLNLATSGNLNATAISSKPALSSPSAAVVLLVLDPNTATLKKSTLESLVLGNPDLVANRSESTMLNTNDSFLIWDPVQELHARVEWQTVSNLIWGAVSNQLVWPVSTNVGMGFVGLMASNHVLQTNEQVGIVAEEVVLKRRGDGGVKVVRDVSVVLDLSDPGINGLDDGLEEADTWYYLWLVAGETNAVGGLFSKSRTGPVLPDGYEYECLVGAVRNNAAGDLQQFFQRDRSVWFPRQIIFDGLRDTVAGASFRSLSGGALDAFLATVPPIAKSWSGMAGRVDNLNTVEAALHVAGSTNGYGGAIIAGRSNVTNTLGFNLSMPLADVPVVDSPPQLYWRSTSSATSNRVDITGWKW